MPGKAALLKEINSAAERFAGKLQNIDIKDIGISDYNHRYWQNKLDNLTATLQLYTYLLALSLDYEHSPLSEITLVDYGGGTGFFSFLAKELGVGTVIYVDIYNISCNDAGKMAEVLGTKIDYNICGGINEATEFFKENSLSADGICSYDVIEHIYDMEEYLGKINFLSKRKVKLVFASSANIANPIIRRRLMNVHRDFEFNKREQKWGKKDSDSLESYFEMRKKIINDYDSTLTPEIIDEIAVKTRGLMKDAIERCIVEYQETGSVQYTQDHPTNTCDPYTGNWAERLMDAQYLREILEREKFRSEILPGFWGSSLAYHKNFIKNILNIGINLMGSSFLAFSPYYIVYACRSN